MIVATRPWNAALVRWPAAAARSDMTSQASRIGEAERGPERQRDHCGVGQGAKEIRTTQRDERPADERQRRDEVVAGRESAAGGAGGREAQEVA